MKLDAIQNNVDKELLSLDVCISRQERALETMDELLINLSKKIDPAIDIAVLEILVNNMSRDQQRLDATSQVLRFHFDELCRSTDLQGREIN